MDHVLHHPPRDFQVIDWGRTKYGHALEKQLAMVGLRREGAIPDSLVLTEHDPVFTLGVRKSARTHLLWDMPTIRQKGAELHETRRGGDITFHGPGQIVGYPILDLAAQRDLHAYLRGLEEVVIELLHAWDLHASRRRNLTGVWIEHRKICAIGIGVKRWITYHGFALNVNTDLSWFSGIVPCGITDGTVTSLQQELGSTVSIPEVKARLVTLFLRRFAPANTG